MITETYYNQIMINIGNGRNLRSNVTDEWIERIPHLTQRVCLRYAGGKLGSRANSIINASQSSTAPATP
jgi:hypothetical protein